MGKIHVAGLSLEAPDHVAVKMLVQVRAFVDEGKFETMSIDQPDGSGAAFLVGPGLPFAITTDGRMDADTFRAQGVPSRTIADD